MQFQFSRAIVLSRSQCTIIILPYKPPKPMLNYSMLIITFFVFQMYFTVFACA